MSAPRLADTLPAWQQSVNSCLEWSITTMWRGVSTVYHQAPTIVQKACETVGNTLVKTATYAAEKVSDATKYCIVKVQNALIGRIKVEVQNCYPKITSALKKVVTKENIKATIEAPSGPTQIKCAKKFFNIFLGKLGFRGEKIVEKIGKELADESEISDTTLSKITSFLKKHATEENGQKIVDLVCDTACEIIKKFKTSLESKQTDPAIIQQKLLQNLGIDKPFEEYKKEVVDLVKQSSPKIAKFIITNFWNAEDGFLYKFKLLLIYVAIHIASNLFLNLAIESGSDLLKDILENSSEYFSEEGINLSILQFKLSPKEFHAIKANFPRIEVVYWVLLAKIIGGMANLKNRNVNPTKLKDKWDHFVDVAAPDAIRTVKHHLTGNMLTRMVVTNALWLTGLSNDEEVKEVFKVLDPNRLISAAVGGIQQGLATE